MVACTQNNTASPCQVRAARQRSRLDPRKPGAANGPQTRVGAFLNPNPLRTLRIVSLVLVGVWCVWWAVSLYHGESRWLPSHLVRLRAGLQRRFSHRLRLSYPDLAGGRRSVRRQRRILCLPAHGDARLRLVRLGDLASGRGDFCVCAGADRGLRCLGRLAHATPPRLSEIPLATVLVAVLYSFPVVFAMERGNCDLLTVLLILCALVLLRRKSPFGSNRGRRHLGHRTVAQSVPRSAGRWAGRLAPLARLGWGSSWPDLLFGLVNFQEVATVRQELQAVHQQFVGCWRKRALPPRRTPGLTPSRKTGATSGGIRRRRSRGSPSSRATWLPLWF